MVLRVMLSTFFLLVAAALLRYSLQDEKDIHDLFLNLGSELVGIVATVALVDALQERRRRQEEARRICWEVLHELDQAMWVWQGGAREFDIDELLQLCDTIKDSDPFPDFTETLLLRIGTRSENTFRTRPDILKSNKYLGAALTTLQALAAIRNTTPRKTNLEVARTIKSAVQSLAAAVRAPIGGVTSNTRPGIYNASVHHQEWRHYGAPLPKEQGAPQPDA